MLVVSSASPVLVDNAVWAAGSGDMSVECIDRRQSCLPSIITGVGDERVETFHIGTPAPTGYRVQVPNTTKAPPMQPNLRALNG